MCVCVQGAHIHGCAHTCRCVWVCASAFGLRRLHNPAPFTEPEKFAQPQDGPHYIAVYPLTPPGADAGRGSGKIFFMYPLIPKAKRKSALCLHCAPWLIQPKVNL